MTELPRVTSHVGRDLLQNSVYFSTVPKVVWEYVSNALDNPSESGIVNVEVVITKDRITITDNGAGMDRSDLRRFFQMHGENIRRKTGKNVRGRFGTGKCAAFGVASKLRIETVKNGWLNVVELDRAKIEQSAGKDIPVDDVKIDASTPARNGTRVIILGLQTKQLEIPNTISYVQRHLGRMLQPHIVAINDHICEVEEPLAVKTREFRAPPEVAAHLGDLVLTIKVSPLSLPPEQAGVDVYSYGNWHDSTLADLPVTDVTRRIFGEVDIQKLEDYEGPFPPFDNTRNNKLSPQNPLVTRLFAWLQTCIKEIVAELEAEELQRKRTAAARALEAEARKIERLINEDFQELQIELEKVRRSSPFQQEEAPAIGPRNSDAVTILPDTEGTVSIDSVMTGPAHGDGTRGTTPADVGDELRPGSGIAPGEGTGAYREQIKRPSRGGGFRIDFRNLSERAHRSTYEDDIRTIVINLDHPQVQAAWKLGGHEPPGFRQLSYEIAFVEYAMAITVEHAKRDPLLSGEDTLFEIRDAINRITRRLGAIF